MTISTAANLLGLSGAPTAEQVKAAYRRQVRLTHPDMTGTIATEPAFRLVVEAYHCLLARLQQVRDVLSPIELSSRNRRPGLTDWDHWMVFYWGIYFPEFKCLPVRPLASFVRNDSGGQAIVSLFIKGNELSEDWKRLHWFSFVLGDNPCTYERLVGDLGEPKRVDEPPVSTDDKFVDQVKRRLRDAHAAWRAQ